MPKPVETVSMTLRLPRRLHESVRGAAIRRGVSVNALIAHSVEQEMRRQRENDLYDAFTLVGRDADGYETEWMLPLFQEAAVGAR